MDSGLASAIAVAIGGDCLADLAVLRAEPAVFGPVASDPTVSRLIATLAGDPCRALAAINSARASVRAVAWKAAGPQAPDHRIDADTPLINDIDATLITAHFPAPAQTGRTSNDAAGFASCYGPLSRSPFKGFRHWAST